MSLSHQTHPMVVEEQIQQRRMTMWDHHFSNLRILGNRPIAVQVRPMSSHDDEIDDCDGEDLHADLDLENLPPFPTRLTEKLKAIRLRLKLSPDAFAPLVGAKDGAEIESYEIDLGSDVEGGLLVTTLLRYVNVAQVPVENLWDDTRDLWFGHRVN